MQLTKNFSLREMTFSETASRRGLDNTPNSDQIDALIALCENVLQPARDALGPLSVSSGFRSGRVNRAVRGSKRSQHIRGEAADIRGIHVDLMTLGAWIEEHCELDQLILEFERWIHVSYRAGRNRKQVLRIDRAGTSAFTFKQS